MEWGSDLWGHADWEEEIPDIIWNEFIWGHEQW